MPSLLEREKLSALKFLDLGLAPDIREIAERFKIRSLNPPIEAYIHQFFHRHRCPEPIPCGTPGRILEQPDLRIRLASLLINLVKDCRPNSGKICVSHPSSLHIGADLEFKRR